MTTSFRWDCLGPDGSRVPWPAETFADQESAEAWLGERWAELRESGVDAVTLLDRDAVVYGPMSLREE